MRDGGRFLDGGWTVLSLGGWEGSLPDDPPLSLEFTPAGGLAGYAGCNHYMTEPTITDTEFSVGPIAATRMACPEPAMSLEQHFLGALEKAAGHRMEADRLVLLDTSGRVLVVFGPGPVTI